MTPDILMEHLQKYLQSITKGMLLGPHKVQPNIYKVDLPARATPEYDDQETDIKPLDTTIPDERDERWPFIIIAFSSAEDNDEGYRTLQIDFVFGCEGGDRDAFMDVLHLMEHVRISFYVKPMMDGRFVELDRSTWESKKNRSMITGWDICQPHGKHHP